MDDVVLPLLLVVGYLAVERVLTTFVVEVPQSASRSAAVVGDRLGHGPRVELARRGAGDALVDLGRQLAAAEADLAALEEQWLELAYDAE